MGKPYFSVIMPAHNAAAHIEDAIDSVLAQTFPGWELLIVDDGSTDESRSIANAYASTDQRVHALYQRNSGTASARNTAIDQAQGEWCLMLDADDLLRPDCMSVYSEFLGAHPGLNFASCYVLRLQPDGGLVMHNEHASLATPGASVTSMLHRVTIVLPGTCVRTSVLKQAGCFRTDSYTEDVELWFSLLLGGEEHLFCPVPLAVWRVSRGGKSSQHVKFAEAWVAMLKRLDQRRLGELELLPQYHKALDASVSTFHLARLQAAVVSGNRRGLFHYVWTNRRALVWTPANTLRVLALLTTPYFYRHWLSRGGRRQDAA